MDASNNVDDELGSSEQFMQEAQLDRYPPPVEVVGLPPTLSPLGIPNSAASHASDGHAPSFQGPGENPGDRGSSVAGTPTPTSRRSSRTPKATARAQASRPVTPLTSAAANGVEAARAQAQESGSRPPSSSGVPSSNSMIEDPQTIKARVEAFQAWGAMAKSSSEPYRLGPFALMLIDEFCRRYELKETLRSFQTELAAASIEPPTTELWLEMYQQCRAVFESSKRKQKPVAPGGPTTLIEQLLDFCVNPMARKAAYALEVLSASSPVTICASPKRTPKINARMPVPSPIVRPSQRLSSEAAPYSPSPSGSMRDMPSASTKRTPDEGDPAIPSEHEPTVTPPEENDDQHELGLDADGPNAGAPSPQHPSTTTPPNQRSSFPSPKKTRKKRKSGATGHRVRAGSLNSQSSMFSVGSRSTSHLPHHHLHNHHNHHLHHHHQQQQQLSPSPHGATGTFGEPALVGVHASELRRDLSSLRVVERELRQVRLETITTEPKRALQKRLGFLALSPEELAAQQRDPYETALLLERYGFSRRRECALCQFAFLEANLPHRVSFKCIMDVHAFWGYEPPDRATASKYKAPLCYDAVLICRMCAQIVFQHTARAPELLMSPPRTTTTTTTTMSTMTTARRVKSLSSLTHDAAGDEGPEGFCSDPYALPPLFADDVYDHELDVGRRGGRPGRGGRDGDGGDGDGALRMVTESPAKAIVYAQQLATTAFMSAKEWEVINPERSRIRGLMEDTAHAHHHPPLLSSSSS